MAGIDEVLERLVFDGDFRAALARDPAAALAGYDLTRDDIELLAGRLDDSDDAERTVEQRTSKSAMLALLSSFAGPGGGGAAGPGHEDRIDVLSWDWGETHGDDTVPDDLAVPDDAADELYNKSKGNVEYSWKVEEGVKAEVEMDDLTHKVEPDGEQTESSFVYGKVVWSLDADDAGMADADHQMGATPDALTPEDGPGGTAPGAPSTDDEGIIIINGLEDDGLEDDGTAPAEDVGLNYVKATFEETPPDPALADVGDEPEESVEAFMKVEDIKGEVPDSAAPSPEDGPADLGGVKAEVDPDLAPDLAPDPGPDLDPDALTHKVDPGDDDLGARTDVTAAMDADDVMEIEDV